MFNGPGVILATKFVPGLFTCHSIAALLPVVVGKFTVSPELIEPIVIKRFLYSMKRFTENPPRNVVPLELKLKVFSHLEPFHSKCCPEIVFDMLVSVKPVTVVVVETPVS